jgi:hypothetical protein
MKAAASLLHKVLGFAVVISGPKNSPVCDYEGTSRSPLALFARDLGFDEADFSSVRRAADTLLHETPSADCA